MMQEVEDPRVAKRAMAEEMWRQEELRVSQQEVAELPPSPTCHLSIGSTSRTSLMDLRDTPKHKEESLIENGKQCD